MATILLDTDVVSFLIKGDTRATAYAPLVQGNTVAVSFMTVAELFQWAAVRRWGARRLNHLEQALAAYLVVPVDIDTVSLTVPLEWGHEQTQSSGDASERC